jgi:archaellum biogenesis protein FlaJ (TadC family)
MSELVASIREYQGLFEGLGLASLALFVFSLVVFPLVVANLPEDYFVRDKRVQAHHQRRHPVVWVMLSMAKNIFGFVLILAGIAMLVLPGQGILTILMGVALANFPGKFTLERRLVQRPSVGKALNRIRALAGKDPLELPARAD